MKRIYNAAGKTNAHAELAPFSSSRAANTHRRPFSALEGDREDEIELIIPYENVVPAVETIMWRFQTSLPIVQIKEVSVYTQKRVGFKNQLFHMSKTRKYSLQNLQKQKDPLKGIRQFCQNHKHLSSCLITVKIEDVTCRLSELNTLPFAQAIFLLKEMLVGFEALIDVFGFFEPRDSLVAVTPSGRWKLWMDQNFGSQQKKQCNITQKQFIHMLISMTQNHSIASSQSKAFFSFLKEYASTNNCTFLKTLEKIHHYVTKNKIYQVSRVIIDHNVCSKVNNEESIDNRITSIKNLFSYPFTKTQNIRSKSSNKPSNHLTLPAYYNFERHPPFKKSIYTDSTQHFLSHKISPILSPMSPGVSQQLSFTQLSEKWPSANFLTAIPSPPMQPKPTSQISKSQKRPNMRKYSEQNIKLQGFHKEKCGSSTICNISFGQQAQREQAKHKSKQHSSHKQLQSFRSLQNPSLSPQNSSSTKQMGHEDERFQSCNYNSMKRKDLANGRFKNNKSLINKQPLSMVSKQNMTTSHQFVQNKRSESEDEMSPKKTREDIWVNKISDLFSDTVSIKQLKESIRLKGKQGKQEEHFEKQYLKDVKLDLLQKFGRKVNAPVTIAEGEEDYYHRKQDKQLNYRSMQLIEQELQQVISHVEDDTKLDDIGASQSIQSMRSRKYAQRPLADREISFKDDFIKAESKVAESSVFNFETEMYIINPKSN